MYFKAILHENGKWVLIFENEEKINFYSDDSNEIYFFNTKEEALEHLETFEVQTLYGHRLNRTSKALSGKELYDACVKLLKNR